MTKERWLYVILGVLFVGYAAMEHYAPKPLEWIPSYAPNDKQPYGGYVLYDRLGDFFDEKEISFETIYELEDSTSNIMILCTSFKPSKEDVQRLMNRIELGENVLIGTGLFGESFLDSLGLGSDPDFSLGQYMPGDSAIVRVNGQKMYFPTVMLTNHFKVADSTGWNVLASGNGTLLIEKSIGQGKLVLTTVPLAFTNYGLLKGENYLFAETALNQLAQGKILYNRYYQVGRGESSSPLRFLISQPALRWALYLTLVAVLLILIVNSRRKQRAIPLLDPKTNTTVAFIKTMGALYFREGNHRKAAEKLVNHFLKNLTHQYYVTDFFNEGAYARLAAKSGLKQEEVIQTFDLIQYVKNGGAVSEGTLADLNQKISRFNL